MTERLLSPQEHQARINYMAGRARRNVYTHGACIAVIMTIGTITDDMAVWVFGGLVNMFAFFCLTYTHKLNMLRLRTTHLEWMREYTLATFGSEKDHD